MDDSPVNETREARRGVVMVMIAKKENERQRASGLFLMLSSGWLNSVRQVDGDLPYAVVCAASAQFSTLSAQFSTLSTHLRVWVFCLPYAPQPQEISLISPHMERTRGNNCPCAVCVREDSPHLPSEDGIRGTIPGRDILLFTMTTTDFTTVIPVCCRPLHPASKTRQCDS